MPWRSYFFWLIIISLFCFILERFFSWRTNQKIFREQFWLDVFLLIFNGYVFGVIFNSIKSGFFDISLFKTSMEVVGTFRNSVNFINDWPIVFRFLFFLFVKDFVEWNIHRYLHKSPFLWRFHRMHHSIKELDWIGNFRFHFMEILIYQFFSYLGLFFFQVSLLEAFYISLFSTLIGHLNHSNLNWSYGCLKYLFNSPRMHVWHHDKKLHLPYGQNFGIVFSLWDWLFKTVYWPRSQDQPNQIGFKGDEKYPKNLLARLEEPFSK